jgi:hypothetical protein
MLYDLDFIKRDSTFPPVDEYDRLKLYDNNRLLWKGEHKQIFRERYNQLFDVDELEVWQFDFNWYRRVSVAFANLLFGEPPKITVGEPESKEQIFLNSMLDKSDFITICYDNAIDISRYGTGIFKPLIEEGTIRIDSLSPAYWFPIFDAKNMKKIIAHFVCWIVGEELFVEVHTPGQIEYRTYNIRSGIVKELIETSVVLTKVNTSLIVPAHNLTTSESAFGTDDYQILDTIICELEIRFSQVARILDKHASPTMYGPKTLIQQDKRTGKAFVDIVGKYLGANPNDVLPAYLVWDAQLSAVNQEIDNLMIQLYALSETAPALFGELKAGLAESGSALKRLLISPLSKVNRLRLSLDKKIKQVLALASELAVANSVADAVKFEAKNVHIDWQDGLPTDAREQIDIESMAVASKLSSIESALKRLWGLEGEALTTELTKIKEENALPAPPTTKIGLTEEELTKLGIGIPPEEVPPE